MPPQQPETRTPEQHFEALLDELNLPRELAVAIREQESRGQPFQTAPGQVLTSPKGARGWFQVRPETAAGYGLDASDPFQNIEAGLRYIKEGLEKNGYDPDLAARYYHGGPDRQQWGPLTETYGREVGQRMRALLAANAGQASTIATPAAATTRPGDIRVPTAEELARRTAAAPSAAPTAPPAPPWYSPERLKQTLDDLEVGVLKGAGSSATTLGRAVHAIPGVSTAIDTLYGQPGLSQRAFAGADDVLQPTNTAQTIGKFGEQIAEAFIPGGAITRTGARATAAVAPRLAPYVGQTVARLIPRAGVEAAGAAGIAAVQGQDPTTAAGIAAAIPAAGAVLRLPFAATLDPITQRAVDFGRAHGIPVDLATATANQWVRRLQTALENTPFGAPIRARVERVRGTRLAGLGEDIAGQVHPAPVTPAMAGHSVANALDARVADLGTEGRQAYQEAERIHALPQHTRQVPSGQVDPTTNQPILVDMQVPIDLAPIRQALRPLLQGLLKQPIAQQQASPALPALRELFRGGPFRALLDLEADLGAIKGLADASGGLRTKSQGLAAKGVQVLQDAIDTAASQTDPQLLGELQKGRRATALKHAADAIRTKFKGTPKQVRIRGAEPMRGYKQVIQPDDVNVSYLTRLGKEVGQTEMRKLGRGFLQDLLTEATEGGGFKHAARVANRWESVGPQTKALLYAPQHVEALDNFFRLSRRLAEHPNPSGTAVMGIAAGSVPWALRHPESGVPALIVSGGLAGLMNTPGGVRLLTQGLTIPGGTPAAATWAAQVRAFLATRPREETRDQSPPSQNAGPPPRQ